MRYQQLILIVLTLFLCTSCNSVPPIRTMEATLIKDCTGVYLRKNNTDYLVCNSNRLNDIENGSVVKVQYQRPTYCPQPDHKAVCKMHHEYKEIIEFRGWDEK